MPDVRDPIESKEGWQPPAPAGVRRRLWLWLRRHRGAVALVVVIAAVATVLAVEFWPDDSCGGSDSGVREIDGECVGVTDGGYAFHDSFTSVQNKILAENRRVSGSGHTVTMALLDPLTVDDTSAVTLEQVRNELEGAYTAQFRINHTAAVGDRRPLVRLVLANWGSHELQWQPVVEQLEGMVNDPEPLVAVVGLRLSTVETERAAKHLARRNIPLVSSIATADQLSQMLNLNSLDTVPGAAGQLSFSFRGADSGNPSNKPVPVIEVPSTAAAQTAEVHHTK